MTDHPRTPEAAITRLAELGGDESVIPKGDHCYIPKGMTPSLNGEPPRLKTEICPYWALRGEQDGYCAKLGCGDSDEDGTMLLFDQVKECRHNRYTEEEEARIYGLDDLDPAAEQTPG